MATRPIKEHIQRFDQEAEIELFVLDASRYGVGVHRFVGGDEGSVVHSVTFDTDDYSAWPCKATGWKASASGVTPRPTLALANVSGLFTPLILNNNDLKGCTVQRIRTYGRYLDDGSDPDPTQILPLDTYKINRLVALTETEVQWELMSYLDQQDVLLPGRTMARDYCGHNYRWYNGSGFVYTDATCPYVGSTYQKRDGTATTNPAEDDCNKLLTACRYRFGQNAELPTRAFAGLARLRVS